MQLLGYTAENFADTCNKIQWMCARARIHIMLHERHFSGSYSRQYHVVLESCPVVLFGVGHTMAEILLLEFIIAQSP